MYRGNRPYDIGSFLEVEAAKLAPDHRDLARTVRFQPKSISVPASFSLLEVMGFSTPRLSYWSATILVEQYQGAI